MEGTVVVQKAGTPYPHNAQFYLNAGAADRWSDLGAAQLSVPQFPFKSFGTTLAAGIAPGLFSHPPSQATVLRFLSSGNINFLQTGGNRTIKVGTTLTFVNESNNEPHTVTVVPAGQHALPNIPTDPASGGTVFDGSHLVNSGTFLPGQSFSLKFTKGGNLLLRLLVSRKFANDRNDYGNAVASAFPRCCERPRSPSSGSGSFDKLDDDKLGRR